MFNHLGSQWQFHMCDHDSVLYEVYSIVCAWTLSWSVFCGSIMCYYCVLHCMLEFQGWDWGGWRLYNLQNCHILLLSEAWLSQDILLREFLETYIEDRYEFFLLEVMLIVLNLIITSYLCKEIILFLLSIFSDYFPVCYDTGHTWLI